MIRSRSKLAWLEEQFLKIADSRCLLLFAFVGMAQKYTIPYHMPLVSLGSSGIMVYIYIKYTVRTTPRHSSLERYMPVSLHILCISDISNIVGLEMKELRGEPDTAVAANLQVYRPDGIPVEVLNRSRGTQVPLTPGLTERHLTF